MKKVLRMFILPIVAIALLLVWQAESFADTAWFGPPNINNAKFISAFRWGDNTPFLAASQKTLADSSASEIVEPTKYTLELKTSAEAKKDETSTQLPAENINSGNNKSIADITLPIHVDPGSRALVTLDAQLNIRSNFSGAGEVTVHGALGVIGDTNQSTQKVTGIFKGIGTQVINYVQIVATTNETTDLILHKSGTNLKVNEWAPMFNYTTERLVKSQAGSITAHLEVACDVKTAKNSDEVTIDGEGTIILTAVIQGIPGVNDLVTFEPIKSTYTTTFDTTPDCGDDFIGQFSFKAKLKNTSSLSLSKLVVQVKELTNGNLLHNIDPCGGNGGVGSKMTLPETNSEDDGYKDGKLVPEEYTEVPFIICLKQAGSFIFRVDVLGNTDEYENSALTAMSLNSQDQEPVTRRKYRIAERRGFFGRFYP